MNDDMSNKAVPVEEFSRPIRMEDFLESPEEKANKEKEYNYRSNNNKSRYNNHQSDNLERKP